MRDIKQIYYKRLLNLGVCLGFCAGFLTLTGVESFAQDPFAGTNLSTRSTVQVENDDPFTTLGSAPPRQVNQLPPVDGGQRIIAPLGTNLPITQGQAPQFSNQQAQQRNFSLTPEEREALQAQIDAENAERRLQIRGESFDAAIGSVLPLEPEEIREMLEYFRATREAAETPIEIPEAKVQIETVSLDPGAVPSIVKTAPGHVTTINIQDLTGMPWPIRDVSWAGSFDVTPPDQGGHVIRVTPLSAHGVGNMSIQLVDLSTPITFSLQTGLSEAHYRFDARIAQGGPLASAPIIDQGGLSAVASSDGLIGFLEGVPPSDANSLNVQGVDGRTRLWEQDGQYYIRTPLALLSPAWNQSVRSSDGMNVYALNEASVILLSDQGRVVQVTVNAQVE